MPSFYNRNMVGQPHFDWFLSDWMSAAQLNQPQLQKLTGWSKRKTSDLCAGAQRYNRDTLNDAAHALHVAPYELLLHPADAMALRKMREGGLQLAGSDKTTFASFPLELRTGTDD